MNKKRNKHWFREKEFRRLMVAYEKNKEAQKNLGYIDIEPVPRGFDAYFVLRKDVKNREDAWVFQSIIDMGAVTAWRHKNTFFHKDSKSYNRNDDQHPYFRGINEETYNTLPPQVKKWFSLDIAYSHDSAWNRYGKIYHHHVPCFFFETEVVQHYITKVKVIDEILIQEEVEIKDKIRGMRKQDASFYHDGSVPKSYVRSFNKSHRAQEKQAIFNLLNDRRHEFPGRHRHSAGWSYW